MGPIVDVVLTGFIIAVKWILHIPEVGYVKLPV